MSRSLPTAAVAAVVLMACNGTKADREAKERLFAAEEPPKSVQKASETIDLANATTDWNVWSRLWTMDRVEVTRRVGAHKATTKTHFKWTRQGKTVELAETYELKTDADGDFDTTLTNDQDSGLEFVWAGRHAWARSRYGAFRARRNDRAQQDQWRERATDVLKTVFDMTDRKLHGELGGGARSGSHPARSFEVSIGEPWGTPVTEASSPSPVYGKLRITGEEEGTDGGREAHYAPGPDEDTARRLEFDNRRVPESAVGQIVVDDTTGVIVRAALHVVFRMPEAGPKSGATLDLTVSYELDADPTIKIEPPKNVTAPRMPHAVNDPLWFWAADGGAHPAAAEEEEEPDVGEEEAPVPDKPKH